MATLQKTPKNSVIVIDNVPYNSRNSDSYPESKCWKQQLIDWQKSKNIPIAPKALRSELWILAKKEREKYPSKVIESIASEDDHLLIRLPQCHCELNPIKFALSAEKNHVAHENKDMVLDLVETFFEGKEIIFPRIFGKTV